MTHLSSAGKFLPQYDERTVNNRGKDLTFYILIIWHGDPLAKPVGPNAQTSTKSKTRITRINIPYENRMILI